MRASAEAKKFIGAHTALYDRDAERSRGRILRVKKKKVDVNMMMQHTDRARHYMDMCTVPRAPATHLQHLDVRPHGRRRGEQLIIHSLLRPSSRSRTLSLWLLCVCVW